MTRYSSLLTHHALLPFSPYPITLNPLILSFPVTNHCLWALDIMGTAVHPVENVTLQDRPQSFHRSVKSKGRISHLLSGLEDGTGTTRQSLYLPAVESWGQAKSQLHQQGCLRLCAKYNGRPEVSRAAVALA